MERKRDAKEDRKETQEWTGLVSGHPHATFISEDSPGVWDGRQSIAAKRELAPLRQLVLLGIS
jgi:hypothetical protein